MSETPRVRIYPKVKVRLEDEKITYRKETIDLISKAIESLSLENCSSAYAPLTTSGKGNSLTESDNRPTKIDEKPRKIRASSAQRPRAVLSSPDNDKLIGMMNKRSRERQTVQRNQEHSHSKPIDGKSDVTNTRHVGSMIKSRPSTEVKQSPQTRAVARQRAPI